uniref:Putative ovule protein n=1 Tax=Solanum chacoense TaxID=4108 RepID=A0A0V0HXN9_SOLCH
MFFKLLEVDNLTQNLQNDPENNSDQEREGDRIDRTWSVVFGQFSGQIWLVSPVITLPSPELATRRSLIGTAGAPVVVFVFTGAEANRERGSPVGAGPRDASGRRDLHLLARRMGRRRRPVAGWFSRLLSDRRCSVLRLRDR